MKYNEKIEEAQDKKEFLEAYDHELANFECGKDEGREEGYYEGQQENQRKIIQNMLEEDLEVETIARYLKISVAEVKKLKADIFENKG